MNMNKRQKNLSADERRAATVEAVVELAAEQNPNEITTTAIAKHMGVTQGALFKHFPTKDAILQAVMEFVANRLLSRVDNAASAAPTPAAADISSSRWPRVRYRFSPGSGRTRQQEAAAFRPRFWQATALATDGTAVATASSWRSPPSNRSSGRRSSGGWV